MDRMKKLLTVILTAILAVSVVSAWAVFDITAAQTKSKLDPPAENLSSFSSISDGFQLSITLQANKTQYASGETVPITFAITNTGSQTANFTNQNGNANFNFQVYNSTNNKVYSWSFGAYPLTNLTLPLAPGENYTQTLNWPEINFPSFNQVSSGAYYVIGEVGEIPPYQLQTKPLNITITDSTVFYQVTVSCQPAVETHAYTIGGLAFNNRGLNYPNGTSYYGLYTNLDFNYTISPSTADFNYHYLYVTVNGQPAMILNTTSTPIVGTNLNLMEFTLAGNITNYDLAYNSPNNDVLICQIG